MSAQLREQNAGNAVSAPSSARRVLSILVPRKPRGRHSIRRRTMSGLKPGLQFERMVVSWIAAVDGCVEVLRIVRVTATVLLIVFSLFCGGWVKGVFGMGLPTVALGLLSLSMPPVEAATLIVMPTLATNAWQFMSGPELSRLRHASR